MDSTTAFMRLTAPERTMLWIELHPTARRSFIAAWLARSSGHRPEEALVTTYVTEANRRTGLSSNGLAADNICRCLHGLLHEFVVVRPERRMATSVMRALRQHQAGVRPTWHAGLATVPSRTGGPDHVLRHHGGIYRCSCRAACHPHWASILVMVHEAIV